MEASAEALGLHQGLPFRWKGPSEGAWSYLKGPFGCSNGARDDVRIPKRNSSQAEDREFSLTRPPSPTSAHSYRLPFCSRCFDSGIQFWLDVVPAKVTSAEIFFFLHSTASFWFYLSALMCIRLFPGT